MTEQERAELKAELMKELTEEISAKKQSQESAKALQPVLDKWCNGENIRRITCNIMNVSYVRDINDVEKAQKIADRLCEVIVELAKE